MQDFYIEFTPNLQISYEIERYSRQNAHGFRAATVRLFDPGDAVTNVAFLHLSVDRHLRLAGKRLPRGLLKKGEYLGERSL